MNNLLNQTLRNNQVNINTDGDGTQIISKLRDVKEVFPLMKEVDCPYQAARWPMECQVRTIDFSFLNKSSNRQILKTFIVFIKM